jgi:hypothetical protein
MIPELVQRAFLPRQELSAGGKSGGFFPHVSALYRGAVEQ